MAALAQLEYSTTSKPLKLTYRCKDPQGHHRLGCLTRRKLLELKRLSRSANGGRFRHWLPSTNFIQAGLDLRQSTLMPSVEQRVKAEFAKLFRTRDWCLFKKIGEANLREAAYLKKSDMAVEPKLQLLARNCRKRLLIGVGVELLLKAIYLKRGWRINKPQGEAKAPKFPFKTLGADATNLAKDNTFGLNELIQQLPKVLQMQDKTATLKGLMIARVFRSKVGHVVTAHHGFEPSNYRDVETSLVNLYRDAFAENLSVRFSLKPGEPANWRVSPLHKRSQETHASRRP
jgi:hypothetical protein